MQQLWTAKPSLGFNLTCFDHCYRRNNNCLGCISFRSWGRLGQKAESATNYFLQFISLMSNCWSNTLLHLVFVLFRYNPCPCTGQGVSCRDGEKRPHITFWKDPFTPHSFPIEACPHRDPGRLFYTHFLSSHLLRFPCWLFIGALCPFRLHCSLHSTHFVNYKLSVTYGVYAKCSFVSILK